MPATLTIRPDVGDCCGNAFIVTEKSAKIDGVNGLKKNMDENTVLLSLVTLYAKQG